MDRIHASKTTVNEFRKAQSQTTNRAGQIQTQQKLDALFCHGNIR